MQLLIQITTLVVSPLLGLVVLMLGIIMKQHERSDEEHRARFQKEQDGFRKRLHEAENLISQLRTILRWQKEDAEKTQP